MNTILYGNGFNRLNDVDSWEKLVHVIDDSHDNCKVPNTLQYEGKVLSVPFETNAILRTKDGKILKTFDHKILTAREQSETIIKKNYTLTLGGQNLTITNGNTNEYKVNVVNEDGTLSFVVNSPSYSCTIPMPTENFYLILNKHNYVPRIIYVNVTDNYIQNKCFDNIDMEYYYIRDATINVGYDVTSSVPYGNVTIENGSKLTIDKSNGVIFKNGTECKLGGILEIK